MTLGQFEIAKANFQHAKLTMHVLINKNLKNTTKRFGVNEYMKTCAGDGKPYRLERVAEGCRCYVSLPNYSGETSPFTFDSEDLELLGGKELIQKQEPVLLDYDLESEGKIFS